MVTSDLLGVYQNISFSTLVTHGKDPLWGRALKYVSKHTSLVNLESKSISQ